MKYVWEENDVKCGMMVCRGDGSLGNISFMSSVSYIMGYVGSNKRCVLISITDGAVMEMGTGMTKKEMAEKLSDGNYRILGNHEINILMKYLHEEEKDPHPGVSITTNYEE